MVRRYVLIASVSTHVFVKGGEMAESNVLKWDTMAKHFNALKIPQWGEDSFLKCIKELPIWDGNAEVLDLGCGAGRFSIAMSDKAKHVLGSDISGKMIEFANEKKKEYDRDNIDFVTENWAEIDLDERGYRKKFDLIIGHMTPAIRNVSDIKKINEACRGYCAMATFVARNSDLMKKLYEFLGIKDKKPDKGTIPEIFSYLYENEHMPEVTYYHRDDSKEIEDRQEAFEHLKNHIWAEPDDLPADLDDKINRFLEKHYINGRLLNRVESTIVAIRWKA